ncbi:MAG: Trk system potassium transporter TrkA [Verrucomicrobiales bacterium]|nr:Trk system potassium transporter TrkA [Verrucomicrobiales bacterium]
MKIIIVGAGEIGRHMALSLSNDSHSICVIEADEQIATELDRRLDARVLNGDGSSVNTLLDAGAPECDLFFALTSDNNINLVSSSIAKSLGAGQSICRAHPGLQREDFLFDFRSHFQIDYLFSSERLASVELAKFVRNPDAPLVEEIARGYIELQQIEIPEDCKMAGKPLSELAFPPRVRIGAIIRDGESWIPSATDELKGGDRITLFGEPSRLHEMAVQLTNDGKGQEANVVIFGGGEYGFSLAQNLESWNCRIRIFESDAERCAELTDSLTKATVLNADATSLSELKEERVGDADFFIATSTVDEDNVMTCLQAHSLGTKHCLTLIHRADYADALMDFSDDIGIRAAVSPRDATRRDLMRFITSDRWHLLQKLDVGELIEASVDVGSPAAGAHVKEIEWPPDCILVALLHGIRAMVPSADDKIVAGDHLYAVVSPKAKKSFLKLVSA